MVPPFDPASELRLARLRAGLSQAALAARGATSQAAISDYERGRKDPSAGTLARLLEAAGSRLAVEPAWPVARERSPAQDRRAARQLADVLALAEALPTRHEPELRFPRLRHRLPDAA